MSYINFGTEILNHEVSIVKKEKVQRICYSIQAPMTRDNINFFLFLTMPLIVQDFCPKI
jgi:hypothetical protein